MKIPAGDGGISIATAYRYPHEAVDVITDHRHELHELHELHEVLERGLREGWSHVCVGGAQMRLPAPADTEGREYGDIMALISSSGFAHIRLTVTNIGRSKDFYDRVFGWPAAIDASEKADDPGMRQSQEQYYGGVVYQTPQGTLFGLRPVGENTFDPDATGLDHLSFAVESRAVLERAVEVLSEAGIEHGEVTDLDEAGIVILSFQDPDNINVELTAPLG